MKKNKFLSQKEEDFEMRCGEVYLTFKGNIVFQCTLCENLKGKYTFHGFEEYAIHIKEHHIEIDKFQPSFIPKEGDTTDPLAPMEIFEQALNEREFHLDDLKSEPRLEEILPPATNKEKKAIKRRKKKVETTSITSLSEPDSIMDFGKILETVDLQIKKKRYKREDRKYKCPHCDFAANDSSNLTYHVRRHSNFKPHKCNDCERSFYTKSELNTHRRTHTGERPFLCTDCGRAFMTSGMLSDHVKRHKNIREKECAVCEMKFYSAKQLRAHIVVHCNDRLHKCSECDKGFKQRVALKNHMKLHANKREYHCDYCSSSFNQSSGLYSHMKNKHTYVSPEPESHSENTDSSDLGSNEDDKKSDEIKS